MFKVATKIFVFEKIYEKEENILMAYIFESYVKDRNRCSWQHDIINFFAAIIIILAVIFAETVRVR
jgi:preprotein translocase subunit SecY